jgi:hypothetical protein
MKKQKSFEILESLPSNGPIYISVTENNEKYVSEGFPVRFSRDNGTSWVANFKTGWTNFSQVYEFENQTHLIVIAGGTLYSMNPENEKPLHVYGVGFEKAIKSDQDQIILQEQTNLTIIEKNGEYWTTERLSFDGIKELKTTGNIVSGLAYIPTSDNDLWLEFTLNLENRKITGERFKEIEFIEIKKKWWKFWQTT